MNCSLCIPTYKRANHLNNLLSAIIGMQDQRITEVLIGVSYNETDSIDETTLHLLRIFEIQKIKYKLKSNLNGLLEAKLWFKDTAKENILFIVDDDCIIHKSYLNLLNIFNDQSVAAVSGSIQTPLNINYYKDYSYNTIENPDRNTLCNTLELNENGLVIVKNKYQVYMLNRPEQYKCECLVGTAMFIRKEFLLPDKNYEHGACNYEEFDYTYAAYKAGKNLIFDSGEIAFHLHANNGGMREKKSKEKEINSQYFRKKFNL